MTVSEGDPRNFSASQPKLVEAGTIPQSLQALGFRTGHDIQHANLTNGRLMPAHVFFEKADDVIERAAPIVIEEVIPHLEDFPGRWNPGRFMVFPLGIHAELGTLRFHIYPDGEPENTGNGPFTHNHGWDLYSRNIVGDPYTDIIVDLIGQGIITDPDFKPGEKGLFRLFETRRSPAGRDVLVTDGSVVKAVPIRERVVPVGSSHTIVADTVYHKPTTSFTGISATLVLDSHSISSTTRVLLPSNEPRMDRQRRTVTKDEAQRAKGQLMRALGS